MIQGVKKLTLTPENILSKISEYDIFRYYMPNKDWQINDVTHSPFREDEHPSFLISSRGNSLTFIDFGDTSKRGDCFTFVKMLHPTLSNMNDVLLLIDRDFGLGFNGQININAYKLIVKEYKQPIDIEKHYANIQVITRKFTNLELQYWNEYYQDIEDLKRENVYSISKIFLNKRRFSIPFDEMRFGYFYEGKWKIYRPFADKKLKWVPNNVPITQMDGKHNINNSEFAFVNKSKKDYMVMSKIIPNCCAVQNEGIACFNEENVKFLKENSKRQILAFDSDITGVKNSQQITKIFDFDYCNVPKNFLSEGIKDFALLAKEKGLTTVENYLKQKNII